MPKRCMKCLLDHMTLGIETDTEMAPIITKKNGQNVILTCLENINRVMPYYSFEDTETGEEFELELTYDQLQAFLTNNPQFNQTFRMNLGDPVRMGVTKPPSDFQKYVLGRVKEAHPLGGAVERRYNIPKEI